jgi:anti-sigma factor RsiW
MFNRQGPAVRDDELLSAYIDNRLSASERAQFDARLAAEPALRAQLDELQQVVQAVRAMPRKRAPRSFALDPRRYAPRQTFLTRIYPALRMANAAVALVFVVVLGALFVQAVPGRLAMAPAAAPAPQASGALEMQTSTEVPAQAPVAATVLSEPATMPMATGVAGDASTKSAETQTPAPLPVPEQTLVPPQVAETPPSSTDGGTRGDETPEGPVVTTSITETIPNSPPEALTAPAPTPVPPEVTAVPSGQAADATQANDAYSATPAHGETTTAGPQEPPSPPVDLRWLATVLAVVFVLLMVLTVVARRQMRR